MFSRLCVALAAGAIAAACSHTETRTVVVPADDSCSYYGYVPGSEAYRICAEREAAARRRGRVQASYAEAAIVADSQEACASYGLLRGTERFDRCVQREVSYRRPA
jgi:hypothetical protein